MKKQIIKEYVFVLIFASLIFVPTAIYLYGHKHIQFFSIESFIFILGIFIIFLVLIINLFIQLKRDKTSYKRWISKLECQKSEFYSIWIELTLCISINFY